MRRASPQKLEDGIRHQGLPADELADFISGGPALKRVLDTRASGGVVDLFKVKSRNSFAFRGEIERLGRGQGICFLARPLEKRTVEVRPALHQTATSMPQVLDVSEIIVARCQRAGRLSGRPNARCSS